MKESLMRFLKVVYIILIILILVLIPLNNITALDPTRITLREYNVKCLRNGQLVVLQGSKVNEPWILEEHYLKSDFFDRKEINFHCQYYDQVQSHIDAYLQTRTREEEVLANQQYYLFHNEVIENVSSYPELYKLELVNAEKDYAYVGYTILGILGEIIGYLVMLLIVRIIILYIFFGAISWHPFKVKRINQSLS